MEFLFLGILVGILIEKIAHPLLEGVRDVFLGWLSENYAMHQANIQTMTKDVEDYINLTEKCPAIGFHTKQDRSLILEEDDDDEEEDCPTPSEPEDKLKMKAHIGFKL